MKTQKKLSPKISVNLALQGGGSHGAFTWGVLDRLLEEPTLNIEGLSGASAGGINSAVMACGLLKNAHEGGREELEKFWRAVSGSSGCFSPHEKWVGAKPPHQNWTPISFWMDMYSHFLSPSQFNPLNYNPLQEIIRKLIDFDSLRTTTQIKLFVNATNVETNKTKVFENKEMCEEALLASTCLPTLFQAVEWNKEFYWDGGYMGNPILEPLISNCAPDDIIIVPINAINRKGAPNTSKEILNRLNEITFNSSLMREIRHLIHIKALSQAQSFSNPFTTVRLHCIQNDEYMETIGVSNKYETDWLFLCELRDVGRKTAHQWIKKNFHHLGQKTTMDLTQWKMETPSTTCLG